MDVKWTQPGEYIDLHGLMETVLKLRLRVASLENVQNLKRLGRHSALLNFSASSKTNASGCGTRKAGVTRKARQMPYIAQRVPAGRDS